MEILRPEGSEIADGYPFPEYGQEQNATGKAIANSLREGEEFDFLVILEAKHWEIVKYKQMRNYRSTCVVKYRYLNITDACDFLQSYTLWITCNHKAIEKGN